MMTDWGPVMPLLPLRVCFWCDVSAKDYTNLWRTSIERLNLAWEQALCLLGKLYLPEPRGWPLMEVQLYFWTPISIKREREHRLFYTLLIKRSYLHRRYKKERLRGRLPSRPHGFSLSCHATLLPKGSNEGALCDETKRSCVRDKY